MMLFTLVMILGLSGHLLADDTGDAELARDLTVQGISWRLQVKARVKEFQILIFEITRHLLPCSYFLAEYLPQSFVDQVTPRPREHQWILIEAHH